MSGNGGFAQTEGGCAEVVEVSQRPKEWLKDGQAQRSDGLFNVKPRNFYHWHDEGNLALVGKSREECC